MGRLTRLLMGRLTRLLMGRLTRLLMGRHPTRAVVDRTPAPPSRLISAVGLWAAAWADGTGARSVTVVPTTGRPPSGAPLRGGPLGVRRCSGTDRGRSMSVLVGDAIESVALRWIDDGVLTEASRS
jgi:hypothetical protein